MKTYAISRGWKITIYIISPLIAAIGIASIVFAVKPPGPLAWLLLPMGLLLLLLAIVSLREAIFARIMVDEYGIRYRAALYSRYIPVGALRGFRIREVGEVGHGVRLPQERITVYPQSRQQRRIVIPSHFDDGGSILAWLRAHTVDLDRQEAEAEQEQLLNDGRYGRSAEDRARSLETMRTVARVINVAAYAVAAWVLLFPKPYRLAVYCAIGFPLLCLLVFKASRGLLRIGTEKESVYPIIGPSMGVLLSIVGLRAYLDYHIYRYSEVWTPVLLGTAVLTLLLFFRNEEFTFRKPKEWLVVLYGFFALFFYSYGAFVALNCLTDGSDPALHSAAVLDKRESGDRKRRSYYLNLSPWNGQRQPEEVSVSRALYRECAAGDTVDICLMPGRFRVPWYTLERR